GIIGCAIARELAARGARVSVLEASAIAAGATQSSAGVLAPYIEAPARGPLLELTTRSLSMYDDFVAAIAREGEEVEYRRTGTLEFANDAAAAERLRLEQQMFPDQLLWLDADAARGYEPSVHEGVEGALFAESHGYVRVPQLVTALARTAAAHGVVFREGVAVSAIRSSRAGVVLETGSGTITASEVVLASGSWADQLAIDGGVAQGVRPIRGQLLHITWPGPPIARVLWGPDCYVVPWLDGTLLVGATVEDVGFEQRTTLAGLRDLMDAACALLPQAWRASLVEARAGLRPASADGLPIVGPSDTLKGLTYAVGHYRNGILLAPLTARLVADWVIDRRRDPALDWMRPDRRPQ
ncbi:MAG TPA: glycine oxidase ThiO, partial [Vicinamibacterales bacterium]